MKIKLMKKLVSFAAFAFFALCLSPVLSAQAASGEALKEKYAETIPENIALAKVKTKLNIRSGPGKSYPVIGYMLPDAACYIESIDSNGWAKVKSGEISGYTLTTYLYMEEEAQERAVSTGSLVAVVNADSVRMRSGTSVSTSANIVEVTDEGDSFKLLADNISSSDGGTLKWVKVSHNGASRYLAQKYTDIYYIFNEAVNLQTENSVSSSSLRSRIVSKSNDYLGVPYVWGGNSLTKGVDCSGFVRELFEECGVDISNIPRNSAAMAVSSAGKTVSRSKMQPGDWVFYANSKGTVNHVALYIGNNKIIHASSAHGKIVIGNVDYRTIVKIRSFLD